jgi:pimeloyl-ACP methyl ester carboxylesterase
MTSTQQSAARVRDYVDSGAVHTYYEAEGSGAPLVLLHGGLCTIETWGGQMPALAEKFRVYAPERSGHGRTADIDGPITYENAAAETIAFIEALSLGPAHLVGFSDGAAVAAAAALRRPDLVAKLVLIGQYVSLDGAVPENMAVLARFTPETFPPTFEQAYAAVSPDGPDHFKVVFEKLMTLWRGETGMTVEEFATFPAPTLILIADDDVVTVEHAVALQRTLPDAQLGVVPGTSHALPMEKPDLVNRLILDFLADEQVPKMLVLRDMLASLEAGG